MSNKQLGVQAGEVVGEGLSDQVSLNLTHFKAWLGREQVTDDVLTPGAVRAMSATLDLTPPVELTGHTLPALWHWLYFLSTTPASELAEDGHAKKGGFLPPIPLSRRMWAGGCLEFFLPLCVGERIQRISCIVDIQHKIGASGELVFVTLNHDIYREGQLAIRERQDLVYRDAPVVNAPPPCETLPPGAAMWSRTVEPTPALLFRYSAITFNAHRIHYDRDYAIDVEGYTDLVVHGPLVATLLLGLLTENCPTVQISRFEYRGIRPLLAGRAFELQGRIEEADPAMLDKPGSDPKHRDVLLWAKDADGWVTMSARAQIIV